MDRNGYRDRISEIEAKTETEIGMVIDVEETERERERDEDRCPNRGKDRTVTKKEIKVNKSLLEMHQS